MDSLFAPLSATNPILYNPYTEPQWNRAIKEYEASIDPVESTVAMHFKRNAAPLLSNPQLLLREFQKYRNLLERPTIRRTLVSERDALFSLVNEMIRKFENAVDRVESGQTFDPLDDDVRSNKGGMTSPRVASIVLFKQLESKVASILSTSKMVLNDIKGYDTLVSTCEGLVYRLLCLTCNTHRYLQINNNYSVLIQDSWRNKWSIRVMGSRNASESRGRRCIF